MLSSSRVTYLRQILLYVNKVSYVPPTPRPYKTQPDLSTSFDTYDIIVMSRIGRVYLHEDTVETYPKIKLTSIEMDRLPVSKEERWS